MDGGKVVEEDVATQAPAVEAPAQELDASVTRDSRTSYSQVLGHDDWETGEFKND